MRIKATNNTTSGIHGRRNAMRKRNIFIFMSLLLAALALTWGVDHSYAKNKDKISKVG